MDHAAANTLQLPTVQRIWFSLQSAFATLNDKSTNKPTEFLLPLLNSLRSSKLIDCYSSHFRDQESTKEDEYIAFTTWLLGQLVFVLCQDGSEALYQSSIESQSYILDSLSSRNHGMFKHVIKFYLAAINDLLVFHQTMNQSQTPTKNVKEFHWFSPPQVSTLPDYFKFEQHVFKINNLSQSTKLLEHFLKILSKLIFAIITLCEDLWPLVVDILDCCHSINVQLIALEVVVLLLRHSGYPVNNTVKNIFFQFLNQLLLQLCDVKNLDDDRSLGILMSLFDQIIILKGTGSNSINISLLSTLFIVINNEKVSSLSNLFLVSLCNFVQQLLDEAPEFYESSSKIDSLFLRLPSCPHLFSILEYIFLKKLNPQNDGNARRELESESSCIQRINTQSIFNMNVIWNKVVCIMEENVFGKVMSIKADFGDDSHLSIENKKSLRLLYFFCKTISKLNFEILNKNKITFLNDKLANILKYLTFTVLKESNSDKNLLMDTFFILSQVVTVSGISNEGLECVHLLIAFLSLPWILDSSMFPQFSHSLNESQLNDLKIIAKHYETILSDVSVRSKCLENLAFVSSNICFKWRFYLYKSHCLNPLYQPVIFMSLPLMVVNSSGSNFDELLQFIFSLIEQSKENHYVHLKFSEALPNIICSLSSSCILRRSSSEKLNMHCLKCKKGDSFSSSIDKETEDNIETLKKFVSSYYLNFVTEFIRTTTSDVAILCNIRRNIILSIPYLTCHLSKQNYIDFIYSCMEFMNDTDSSNRLEFAKVVKYTIFSNKWLKNVGADKNCLIKWSVIDQEEFKLAQPFYNEFKKVCTSAVRNSLKGGVQENYQVSLKETLLQVGCVPCDLFLWPTIQILLNFVANPYKKDCYLSSCYIRQIVSAHNMNMSYFLCHCEEEICQNIISQIIVYKIVYNIPFNKSLFDLCSLFAFEISNFVDRYGPIQLSKNLFKWIIKNRKNQCFLQEIADLSTIGVETFIIEGFKDIYPDIVLYHSKEDAQFCCTVMESLSGLTLPVLIRRSYLLILANILVHFCIKEKEAEKAILEMKKYDEKTFKTARNEREEIAEFLQFRFLGLLGELELKLTSQSTSDSIKSKILRSLPGIFNLMGSTYITSVRFKVLVTLCTALTLKKGFLPLLCIKAWAAFVKTVEISALGPMLSTIFVSLYPLIEEYPNEVCNIFYYLVCQNEEHLANNFCELYFLKFHPMNPLVYETVQKYLTLDPKNSFCDNLSWTLKQASHERVEVRLHALNRLKGELNFYHDDISKMILTNDTLDFLIIEILDTLSLGSHDADERVRIACSECFGELGAIDPSLLPNKLTNSELTKKLPLKVDCEESVIHILMTLCQGFQSARHSRNQDEFALAIQEMLKISSVQENSAILSNFPENFRELMKPLFKSTYNRKELDNPEVSFPPPIFGSAKGKTFQSWAFNWIHHLVSLTSDQRIKEIFKYCKGSLRIDDATIRGFMPYIVVNTIIKSNEEQRKQIYDELYYVMSNSGSESAVSNASKFSQVRFARQVIKPYANCKNYDSDKSNELNSDEQTSSILCAKMVFALIDFLFQYIRDDSDQTNPEDRRIVKGFLDLFSKEEIAEKCFALDEFPRALLYLEQYVTEKPLTLQSHLPLFGKIYAQLNDSDGLRGIVAIHTAEPSAEEMLLMHEVTGKLHDAVACYEKLAQKNDNNSLFYKSMIQCYLRIDQPFTALKLTDNIINSKTDFENDLCGEKVEAIWSMMMFDQLDAVLSKPSISKNESWGVRIGMAMSHLLCNEPNEVSAEIRNIYKIISQSLYTTTLISGGYREGYEFVIKLHILNEFEQLSSLILNVLNDENSNEMDDINLFKALVETKFNKRLRLLRPLENVLQPVLSMRRVTLSIAEHLLTERKKHLVPLFNCQIGKCLLKSIKIARKTSNFQMAYSNILEVEKYKPKELFIEKAQLMWMKHEINQALTTLNRGIEIHFSNQEAMLSAAHAKEEKQIHAKAKLLIACYNEETTNIEPNINAGIFDEAIKICNDVEKSYVCYAQFLDKNVMAEYQSYASVPEKLDLVIKTYGKSMLYGCKYLYQSMSKLLSLWLDFGAELAADRKLDSSSKQRKNQGLERREKTLKSIISTIGCLLDRLPTFMFLAAFSQLTSRICHPDALCFNLLKAIIVKCILAYPNQTLWMFMCFHKSPITLRMERFNIVLKDEQLVKAPVAELIIKFKKLVEVMSELCEKKVDQKLGGKCISLDRLSPELIKLFSSGTVNNVMIPFQKFRTLALPRPIEKGSVSLAAHEPFPKNLVYMHSLKKEVLILTSLKRPKRLTMVGSDGKEYSMLFKPKDDLRLDFRLMEFTSIVNMYLKRDAEAKDRDLHIKTYSVAPLIDDCGLIEWVPNLVCSRAILIALYKSKNLGLPPAEVKRRVAAASDPMEKKLAFFRDLKKHYPPVLKEWFFKTFPNPSAWYLARLGYVRTLAVMSIVGFILGLGDRHTENILLNNKSGEIVHVDFNCLFNKGELFEYKEAVPFRLTHNFVDTMGPTGTEGAFIKCCEITNRIMRTHKQLLISVLTPFVYDPLLCWKGARDVSSGIVNKEAKTHIHNIECRLKGSVRKKDSIHDGMYLSIEGQVRSLIQEATLDQNLAQMFFGWGAYM